MPRSPLFLLICLLFSSCRNGGEVALLAVKTLEDFPSASAIEYHRDRIYIFGDDSPLLLITDKTYQRLDTIRFLPDTGFRISKSAKPDIESAAIVAKDNDALLFALGSFSSPERGTFFSFPLDNPGKFTRQEVYSLFKKSGEELNIEGMAITGEYLVLANRANPEQPRNQLILTPFWDSPQAIKVIDLKMNEKAFVGISGLYYVEKRDLLLFTASTEETRNAIEDGRLGDSYLGWIGNFSSRQKQKAIQPDVMINLSEQDGRFKQQKIESICLEELKGKELILHLAADNDNGKSTLFKVRVNL